MFMAPAPNQKSAAARQGSVGLAVKRLAVHVAHGVQIVATCVSVNMEGGVTQSLEDVSVDQDILETRVRTRVPRVAGERIVKTSANVIKGSCVTT